MSDLDYTRGRGIDNVEAADSAVSRFCERYGTQPVCVIVVVAKDDDGAPIRWARAFSDLGEGHAYQENAELIAGIATLTELGG